MWDANPAVLARAHLLNDFAKRLAGNVNLGGVRRFLFTTTRGRAGWKPAYPGKSAQRDCGSDRFGLFFSRRFTRAWLHFEKSEDRRLRISRP